MTIRYGHVISFSSLFRLGLTFTFILGAIGASGGFAVRGQSFHGHTVTRGATTVQAVSAADVDGDGDTDVIAAPFDDDELVWYENQGDESFTKRVISSNVDAPYCIHVADVTGDNRPEVFVGTLHGNNIKWFKNDGSGSFGSSNLIDGAAGAPYSLHVARIDGDQHPDLVAAANDADKIVWYKNDGSNTFSSAQTLSSSSSAQGARSVFAADVTGNGNADIVAASGDNDSVSWFENGGSTFSEYVISQGVGTAASVYAADVTGNGATDVLSAGITSDEIILHENTTAGADSVTFRERVITSSADGAQSVVAADIGGDGDLDIVSASRTDNTVAIYENDGTAQFTERILSDAASGAINVSTADVDSDGNTDVLAASQGDDTVRWFETNLSPTARDTTFEVTEGETLRVSSPGMLGNDGDPDGDTLTVEHVADAPAGTVTEVDTNGSFVFSTEGAFDSVAAGERRIVSITYKVEDEHGLTDTASVQVSVIGVNDAPTARPNVDSTVAGTDVVTDVLENDHDVDGELDPSSLSLAELPSHGSVQEEGEDGISYTPDPEYTGKDRYEYVVADGSGEVDTAQVVIKVRPPPPQISQVESGDQRVELRWAAPEIGDVQSYRVYRTGPGHSGPGEPDTVITDPDTRQYETASLTNRQVYDFLVTAVVPGSVEGVPDSVRTVPRPSTVTLDGSVSFGSREQTTGYRMVGVPGAPAGLVLSATLSGEGGDAWTAYAAQGITETSEMTQFREDTTQFGFEPGRGFWVLSENGWDPSGTVSPLPLNQNGTVSIPLPQGWSVITNPFPEAVSWTQVLQATPGFDAELWAFDGQFTTTPTLAPYEGYFVFNDPDQSIDSLRIPYPVNPGSSTSNSRTGSMALGKTNSVRGGEQDQSVRGLEIRAQPIRQDGPTRTAHLRVGEGTSVGRDAIDQFAPPSIGGENVRLTVHSENASDAYPVLRKEGRPLGSDDVATFDLRVRGPSDQTVRVSGGAFRRISGASTLLYDPATEQVFDLREEVAEIHVGGRDPDGRASRALEVWVGDPETLSDRRDAKAPSTLALKPPAPNPMSASTRLRYSIPASAAPVQTQIVVYDVLGRVVHRLVADRKGAGQHVIQWRGQTESGHELASGVYFCRFIADGKPVETRKITVVR